MGSCLSSSSTYHYYIESNGQSSFSTASVISVNGDLRQYTLPVAVSQVLRDAASSSGKSFVCNSDGLSYNEYIEAMDEEEQLQEDHIYFLLPASKLQYRVAASDMAALAVKAALALQKSSSNSNKKPKASSSSSSSNSFMLHHRRRHSSQNKMARISPLVDDHANANHQTIGGGNYGVHSPKKGLYNKQEPVGVSRSGSSVSVRKLQRYSSRRANMVVRSFRISLSTIHEGSILHFY
ncbi:ATP-dependent RNA helicase DDX20 [Actinidia chinensis var. chinensis]|uniref:ATP-dependent RNA helicase DDX20 n=1 Tax=Actinidia chinensis var. chinensis TaxID=1590841 RepID=A0A2R6RM84_ACTCC|nr:ATP-dependent RNA helicase DDX20 [Actinidia chinensis var. chinensis]